MKREIALFVPTTNSCATAAMAEEAEERKANDTFTIRRDSSG